MINIFIKKYLKRSAIHLLTISLIINLSMPMSALAQQLTADCLSPMVNINNLSLQQFFDQKYFADYLKNFQLSITFKHSENISEILTQNLIERDVDIDYIGTILLAIDEVLDSQKKARLVLDAVDALASYIHVFEDKEIDSDYIHYILGVLVKTDDIKTMALIVSDIDGAVNISRLIKRFEEKNIPADYIKTILYTILSLDDAKQRSVELETLLSSPPSQFIGSNSKTTVSILERIAHIDNLSAFVDKLKRTVTALPENEPLRRSQELRAKQLKQKGEFNRSIVSVCDRKSGKEIGSAFVVQETDNEYFLLTNNHVIDDIDDIVLRTNGLNSEFIGNACVVLSRVGDRRKSGDIALLSIKKENVQGAKLAPIELATQNIDEGIALLISSVNETVSAGQFVLAGDSGILVGATSKPGDSGSPVLVETVGGYAAVAIHSAAGPMSILLTEEVMSSFLLPEKTDNFKQQQRPGADIYAKNLIEQAI